MDIIIKHVAMFLITIFRIDLKIENWNLIPKNGNYVMVSNHQGNFDPIIAAWVFSKDKPTFIMKNNILKVPFIGRILVGAGFLPIDRHNDRKSMQSIVTAIKRVESGGNILVYPEGTRSRCSSLLTFRNGAFKIPQKAKSPIVVVAIDGMYKISKNFPFKKSKVLFRICEVIDYETHKYMHTNELSDYAKNIIEKNLEEARSKYKWLK